MKMLGKILSSESLENSQENFYDGVYLSKAASLRYTDCNYTISRLYRIFF